MRGGRSGACFIAGKRERFKWVKIVAVNIMETSCLM